MTVVRIPPTLRTETGGAPRVEAEGDNVRELLDDLTSRFPALRGHLLEGGDVAPFVNVYVEGEDVRTLDGMDTLVEDGQTVILLPAMAGGSSREPMVPPIAPPSLGETSGSPLPPSGQRLGLPPG